MEKTMRSFLGAFVVIVWHFALVADTVAGELGYQNIEPYTEWSSTDCYKPSPPFSFVNDVESYNSAVYEFNAYVMEIQSYLSCITLEAEEDMNTFQNILKEALNRSRVEALAEIEAARMNLELQK